MVTHTYVVLPPLIGNWFQVYFTPLPGFFSPFPHGLMPHSGAHQTQMLRGTYTVPSRGDEHRLIIHKSRHFKMSPIAIDRLPLKEYIARAPLALRLLRPYMAYFIIVFEYSAHNRFPFHSRQYNLGLPNFCFLLSYLPCFLSRLALKHCISPFNTPYHCLPSGPVNQIQNVSNRPNP